MKEQEFLIQPYTIQELAALYRCSARTLRRWLRMIEDDLGPRMGHYYNPRQVRIIVARLGEP